MRKSMFLGIAAFALMTVTACSTDEIVEVPVSQDDVIRFSTFVDKNTRATDITTENLGGADGGYDFAVFAYHEDEGRSMIHVSKEQGFISSIADPSTGMASTGSWAYKNPIHWQNGNWYFHAIAPWDNEGKSSKDIEYKARNHWTRKDALCTRDKQVFYFDNSTSGSSYENDFLYAYTQVKKPAYTGVVNFTFKHLLSRVKFTFDNYMTGSSGRIVISNLYVNGQIVAGTVTVDNSETGKGKVSWERDDTKEDDDPLFLLENLEYLEALGTAEGRSVSSKTVYFIPIKIGDGSTGYDATKIDEPSQIDPWNTSGINVFFRAQIYDDDSGVDPIDKNLEAYINNITMYNGYSYDFHFKFSNSEADDSVVTFNANVTPYDDTWNQTTDPNSDDVDLSTEGAGSNA